MLLANGEVLIHDDNWQEFVQPVVDGDRKGHGLVPRDWYKVPCGSIPGAPKAAIQKIPRSEWRERIRGLRESNSLNSYKRLTGLNGQPIPSRDQDGFPFCWGHSTCSAAIVQREKEGQPYADLSAFGLCCKVTNFGVRGGWNGESMEALRKYGCPDSEHWPQQSMRRSNDNPETWANAAQFKDTEWADVPDRDFDTLFTYLLLGFHGPLDLNWWRHSVEVFDPVDGENERMHTRMASGKLASFQEFDRAWGIGVGGGFGARIWNSWGDGWSDRGMGVLTESRATPDGSIMLLAMRASPA